jgi:chitinase
LAKAAAYHRFSALAFWLTQGPFDKAQEWASMAADQRAAIKSEYKNAGISLIVSAFGATDTPTTSGADPVDTANKVVSFVKQYDLDGVDVDYEDFDAINSGKAEAWLATFTKTLRAGLPQGQYIICT